MKKTPETVSFDELAGIADKAARKADKQAREAGIEVAGMDRTPVEADSAKANTIPL